MDPSGNILVFDVAFGRWTSFTPEGELLGTRIQEPRSRVVDLVPLAFMDDGRVLGVFGDQRSGGPDGLSRDTTPLLLLDGEAASYDTLDLWPARKWAYSHPPGAIWMRTDVGFGRDLAHAGRSGRVALGDTDSLHVVVYGPEARPVLRLVGTAPPVPVTPEEVEVWRDELEAEFADRPEGRWRYAAEAPHHDTHPAFDALLVDAEGRTWIGDHVRHGEDERLWVIFGAAGRPEGRLTLPAEAELLDAADGRLLLLERNRLDEESVAILRVEPPSD